MAESDDNSQKLVEDAIFNKFLEDAAGAMSNRLHFMFANDKMKNEEDFMSDILPCSVGLLALNSSNCEFVRKNLLDPLEARWRMSFFENNLRESMGRDADFNIIYEIFSLGDEEYYTDFNDKDGIYSFKLWWIILLRFYIQQTKDDTILELKVQKEVHAIVECLLGNSQLVKIRCPRMLEPKTFMSGDYPIEGQATLYFCLKCAHELMNLPQFEDGQRLMGWNLTSMKERINKQITRMDFLIPKHCWLDNSKVANCQTAPLQAGFYQYGIQMKSNKWSFEGNCIAILSSLATPQQAEAIMNFIEKHWEQVIDKDNLEDFHGLLWLLVAASIKVKKVEIAKRAIEVFEKECHPSEIDLRDYKSNANWTYCGYFVSKILIGNNSVISKFSFEKASDSRTEYLSTFLEQRKIIITRFELIKKHFKELWIEIGGAYAEWIPYCRNAHLQKICQQLGTIHEIDLYTTQNFARRWVRDMRWKIDGKVGLELIYAVLEEISMISKAPLGKLLHDNFDEHHTRVRNNLVMVQDLALNTGPVNLREHLLECEHLHIPIPRCERFWTVVEERERTGTCLDCNNKPAKIKLPCGDKYSCEECYYEVRRRLEVPYFCVLCDESIVPI